MTPQQIQQLIDAAIEALKRCADQPQQLAYFWWYLREEVRAAAREPSKEPTS